MSDNEAVLAARLRRMRWTATGLVALMGIVFVVTSAAQPSSRSIAVLRAFAEAALIGGLADWFAVAALFKRPFGLPIPHTAIVPTRKNEIGRALARFVAEHFLVRDAVARRLARSDLAGRAAAWLSDETNARMLTRDIGIALDWLVRGADSAALRSAVGWSVRDVLEHVSVNRVAAAFIDVLASGRHAQTLIDQLVHVGREQLESNKLAIRLRIRERSPWWLPRFVDEEVYDQLVGELERILDEVGTDPDHPARAQFNARLKSLKHRFATDPALIDKTEAMRDEIYEHPALKEFVADLAERVRTFARTALADPNSPLRLGIERELAAASQAVADSETLRAQLNAWLEEILIYVVENYRDALSEVISETIEQWDASSTAKRIELHVGSDLQFIRINGTLVGGLVGVALYFAGTLLSP